MTNTKGMAGTMGVATGLSPVEGLVSWLEDGSGERYLNFSGWVRSGTGASEEPEFLEEVRFKGRMLAGALEKVAGRIPGARVRGEGLRLDLDLGDASPAWEVAGLCEERRVLVGVVGGAVRLQPPVAVTRAEIRIALDALRAALAEIGASGAAGEAPTFREPAVA